MSVDQTEATTTINRRTSQAISALNVVLENLNSDVYWGKVVAQTYGHARSRLERFDLPRAMPSEIDCTLIAHRQLHGRYLA